MKKICSFILLSTLISISYNCSDSGSNDNVPAQPQLSFTFSHNWDGTPVTNEDFNTIQFTNANGDMQSIERMRYVVSDFQLRTSSNELLRFNIINLVDVTNNENLTFSLPQSIPSGTYNLSFTFGLNNETNAQNLPELNTANFGVPPNLGGGYHYMQLDGKYLDSNNAEAVYNYHAIRAVDPGTPPTFPQDTFIVVNLGAVTVLEDTEFTIDVDISEWFKNPHQWDLNVLNTQLMGNSAAQILMYDNGQTVFSLAEPPLEDE